MLRADRNDNDSNHNSKAPSIHIWPHIAPAEGVPDTKNAKYD